MPLFLPTVYCIEIQWSIFLLHEFSPTYLQLIKQRVFLDDLVHTPDVMGETTDMITLTRR